MSDVVKIRRISPSTVRAYYTVGGAAMLGVIGERGIVDVDREIAELWLAREPGEWELVPAGEEEATP